MISKRFRIISSIILMGGLFFGSIGSATDNIKILYQCNSTGSPTGNIGPNFKIANIGTTDIRLSDVTIRYWYTNETQKPQVLNVDYATVGSTYVSGTFTALTNPVTSADTYCEISFNLYAGIVGLACDSGEIQTRIHADDYTNMDQTNDYSFNASASAYTENPRITAYFKGALIYGTDPVTGITAPTPPPPGPFTVTFNINPDLERAPISPYVYGSNGILTGNENLAALRMGGNRMTGYNWENNFSNAGSDWLHSSDGFVPWNEGVPDDQAEIPGIGVSAFHEKAQAHNIPYTMLTLQLAGYVAADKNGTVSVEETAPSARWIPAYPAKGSAFIYPPDLTDNAVYIDEEVSYLVNKYGNASIPTGIKGYSLDNETSLWCYTHVRIHPDQPTSEEIATRGIDMAKAVKNVDPYAEIFGPSSYGMAEFLHYQGAPDWSTIQAQGNYAWFLDYYLERFRQASTAAGKRLLDVLDLHWYPEAYGDGQRICTSDSSYINCNKERMQAPRILWDPTFVENSWIARAYPEFLPLLPRIQATIDAYYPGTKVAFTEYTYGGDEHITGGIAMTDLLGVFGKYGVYMSNYWGSGTYYTPAYKIFRNYDGSGSTYGNTRVKADTSDNENTSLYAAIVGSDDGTLHMIVINKNYDYTGTFNFNLNGSRSYTSGRVWAFDSSGTTITERTAIPNISGNRFSYTIPNLTVCHFVLTGSGTNPTPAPTAAPTAVPTVGPTAIPTEIPTIAPTVEPGTKGDVNGNGTADIVDALLIAQYYVGLNPSGFVAANADVNCSGTIDIVDALLVAQYYVGLITSFPC